MKRLIGRVTVTAWSSNADLAKCSSGRTWSDHFGEMRSPVPPLPDGLGVCEKEKAVERAAGVAEFSGVILVSVRAREWRVMSDV